MGTVASRRAPCGPVHLEQQPDRAGSCAGEMCAPSPVLTVSLSPQAASRLWSTSTPSCPWPCPASWSFLTEVRATASSMGWHCPLGDCHLGCAGGFPASQEPRSGLCLPSGASPWGHIPLLSVLRAVPPAGSCAQLVQSQAGFYFLFSVPLQHWHMMLSSWKGDSASAPTAWWVSKQGAAVTPRLF